MDVDARTTKIEDVDALLLSGLSCYFPAVEMVTVSSVMAADAATTAVSGLSYCSSAAEMATTVSSAATAVDATASANQILKKNPGFPGFSYCFFSFFCLSPSFFPCFFFSFLRIHSSSISYTLLPSIINLPIIFHLHY